MFTEKCFVLIIIVLIALSSVDSSQLWPKPRIVGGYSLDIEEVPYQISLQIYDFHYCGGSIISKNWVITSAQCTMGFHVYNFKVRYGTSYYENGGIVVDIKHFIRHEEFNLDNFDYDFSLLELASDITFDKTTQPIKLPKQGEAIPDNVDSLVTGWGDTHNINESKDKLRAVILPTVSQEKCVAAYLHYTDITDHMMCAGYLEGGKDACYADNGGPLAINGVLIGITSWGLDCALVGFPGIFSRVASVRDWIKEKTGV